MAKDWTTTSSPTDRRANISKRIFRTVYCLRMCENSWEGGSLSAGVRLLPHVAAHARLRPVRTSALGCRRRDLGVRRRGGRGRLVVKWGLPAERAQGEALEKNRSCMERSASSAKQNALCERHSAIPPSFVDCFIALHYMLQCRSPIWATSITGNNSSAVVVILIKRLFERLGVEEISGNRRGHWVPDDTYKSVAFGHG